VEWNELPVNRICRRNRQERMIDMEEGHLSPKARDMIRAGREFLMEQIRQSQQTIDRAQALLKQIDELRPQGQDAVKK
jgi:hypothetical protein